MRFKEKPHSDSYVYGLHTVSAVLRFEPKRCQKLFVARKDYQNLKDLADKSLVPIEIVERSFLEKRFAVGSEAQGVVLQCAPFAYADLEDFLDKKTILVLDCLQDAANVGRAARAALVFGADGIIICKDRSAQITPAAEKAAVGALSQIPVARVVNLASALKKLKDSGFFAYGADMFGDVPVKQCDFADRTLLVIGQEGEGLRELTKKMCDVLINIPMVNQEICLNAADTALLLLYELNRRQ